jgi:hypothetical protein
MRTCSRTSRRWTRTSRTWFDCTATPCHARRQAGARCGDAVSQPCQLARPKVTHLLPRRMETFGPVKFPGQETGQQRGVAKSAHGVHAPRSSPSNFVGCADYPPPRLPTWPAFGSPSSAAFFDATQGARNTTVSGKAGIGDKASSRSPGVASRPRKGPWRAAHETDFLAYSVCFRDNLHSPTGPNAGVSDTGAHEGNASPAGRASVR